MKVSIFTVVLNVSKKLRLIAPFVFTPMECNYWVVAIWRSATVQRLE